MGFRNKPSLEEEVADAALDSISVWGNVPRESLSPATRWQEQFRTDDTIKRIVMEFEDQCDKLLNDHIQERFYVTDEEVEQARTIGELIILALEKITKITDSYQASVPTTHRFFGLFRY